MRKCNFFGKDTDYGEALDNQLAVHSVCLLSTIRWFVCAVGTQPSLHGIANGICDPHDISWVRKPLRHRIAYGVRERSRTRSNGGHHEKRSSAISVEI